MGIKQEFPLHVLHICRRFGPVGGMERYVWELVQGLVKLGVRVDVLCEVNLCAVPLLGVNVYALGEVAPKPRWLAHVRFSQRVAEWVAAHPKKHRLIHSHERTSVHQITTFHGPPYAEVLHLPWWKRVSLRVFMNLWLEKRELCAPQVRCVIPNSKSIQQQLLRNYAEVRVRLSDPIEPGVQPCQSRVNHDVSPQAGVVGFIGKEWKRKGLKKAVPVMEALTITRPNIIFLVAGVEEQEVKGLFRDVSFSYHLLGYVEPHTFYAQLDLLLHPAKKEPYGMVISEALSSGVPVVISNVCGAAPSVRKDMGKVLCLTDTPETWAKAMDELLCEQTIFQPYRRNWEQVAKEHLPLYKKIQQQIN